MSLLGRSKLPTLLFLASTLSAAGAFALTITSETLTQHWANSEPRPVRIMPLGDSITQASPRYDSYRRSLWLQLRQAGYEVDFVGSHQTHFEGPAPRQDFDQDHEGHWGWRVDEILSQLSSWTRSSRPDIVLVHLGTNDIAQGQSIDSTVQELRSLVQVLRQVNPRVTVLLAQIIPLWGSEARMQQLNQKIAQLAQELNTEASRVLAIDQFTGFDPVTGQDTYDGCHPNERGERHLADRWFAGLKQVLPTPRATPSP
jgi:lysophospholipase L1-like esterase